MICFLIYLCHILGSDGQYGDHLTRSTPDLRFPTMENVPEMVLNPAPQLAQMLRGRTYLYLQQSSVSNNFGFGISFEVTKSFYSMGVPEIAGLIDVSITVRETHFNENSLGNMGKIPYDFVNKQYNEDLFRCIRLINSDLFIVDPGDENGEGDIIDDVHSVASSVSLSDVEKSPSPESIDTRGGAQKGNEITLIEPTTDNTIAIENHGENANERESVKDENNNTNGKMISNMDENESNESNENVENTESAKSSKSVSKISGKAEIDSENEEDDDIDDSNEMKGKDVESIDRKTNSDGENESNIISKSAGANVVTIRMVNDDCVSVPGPESSTKTISHPVLNNDTNNNNNNNNNNNSDNMKNKPQLPQSVTPIVKAQMSTLSQSQMCNMKLTPQKTTTDEIAKKMIQDGEGMVTTNSFTPNQKKNEKRSVSGSKNRANNSFTTPVHSRNGFKMPTPGSRKRKLKMSASPGGGINSQSKSGLIETEKTDSTKRSQSEMANGDGKNDVLQHESFTIDDDDESPHKRRRLSNQKSDFVVDNVNVSKNSDGQGLSMTNQFVKMNEKNNNANVVASGVDIEKKAISNEKNDFMLVDSREPTQDAPLLMNKLNETHFQDSNSKLHNDQRNVKQGLDKSGGNGNESLSMYLFLCVCLCVCFENRSHLQLTMHVLLNLQVFLHGILPKTCL